MFNKKPSLAGKKLYVWIQRKRKYISNLIFSIVVINFLRKKFLITQIGLRWRQNADWYNISLLGHFGVSSFSKK